MANDEVVEKEKKEPVGCDETYWVRMTKDFDGWKKGDKVSILGEELATYELNDVCERITQEEFKEVEDKNDKKILNWLNLSPEDLERLDEEKIKEFFKDYYKNPETLKSNPLNTINIFGNKIVKTQIRVDAIEKGLNLVKGWEATCPECEMAKTVYNPYLKSKKFCGCTYTGARGGEREYDLEMKPLNDTGYWIEVSCPTELTSSTSQNIFISLNKLPKNLKDLQEFERLIQTNIVEIVGIIRVKKSKERNWTEWFIDVEDYKIVNTEYKYDIKKIKKLDGIPRNDLFFDKYFAPNVIGSILEKKTQAIALCNPHEIKFPNNKIDKSFIKILRAGDPGQAKTVLAKKGFIEYSPFAGFYTVENATTKGLVMTTRKSKSGGRWTTTLGVLPKHHKGGVVLDGIGKLDQSQLSELRGIKEEGIAQSVKASGNSSAPCSLNILSLGNIKKYIKEYPTKHLASYDVAINSEDRSSKFSGADRRREDFVLIISNDDLNTMSVSSQLLRQKEFDFDDVGYWNNVNSFAWSRKPEQIKWEEGIENKIIKAVEKLNQSYKDFELDYAVLGKQGSLIFAKMLPGVAIIHGSIEDENVIVKKEYVDWLLDVFEEMFIDLGLDAENEKQEHYNTQAELIVRNCNAAQKEVLILLSTYGSQSAVEKAEKMSRKTIYNRLKNIVEYFVQYEISKEERENLDPKVLKKKEFETLFYSFHEGSCNFVNRGSPHYPKMEYESNGELPGLIKRDGSFTQFGRIILKKARQQTRKPSKKIKKEVENAKE